ncbi:relA-associated inhibitor [Trichomycterus rosablanca]|uniref:relA-associated inhibitor n=1 Tax=Trichomycterus rosablanca TaxID=2290929 RepID=UPI002F35ED96
MSNNMFGGSSMLFHAITEDLNASLATADELSREFNSLFQEISSTPGNSTTQSTNSRPEDTTRYSSSDTSSSSFNSGNYAGISSSNNASISSGSRNTSSSTISSGNSANFSSGTSASTGYGSTISSSSNRDGGGNGGTLTRSNIALPQISAPIRYSEPSTRSPDSFFSSGRTIPTSPNPLNQPYPPQARNTFPEPGYPRGSLSPSPHSQRRASPSPIRSHERNLSGSFNFSELPPSHKYEMQSLPNILQVPGNPVAPYDSATTGRRSPRMDPLPSTGPFSQPMGGTLPRNFMPFKSADDTLSRQKSPSKWNETDLDVSYEQKPHHTYEKNEWIRPTVSNSNWRESNLDSPTMPRKENLQRHLPAIDGTLTRTTRITVPPDRSSPTQSQSHYSAQPISRISIPPASTRTRPHRPIPLSVIMRLQNPYYASAARHPCIQEGEMVPVMPSQPVPLPREFLYHFQPVAPLQMKTAHYGEVPSLADVDAEVSRLNSLNKPAQPKTDTLTEDPEPDAPPRPLSPTRLQPVVAPEVPLVPDLDEVLRIRAEIPRALKKRGSTDMSQSIKMMPVLQSNPYRQMINKLFRRKGPQTRGEIEGESSSSDEESPLPHTMTLPQLMTMPMTPQQRGLHSILRTAKGSGVRGQSPRARLSPLVLLLDGALVGELDTVQRAVQEMSDPSQPNDEGITGLHNAICGGHYAVVEFLVQISANVSAPDSHGWTPLHCAASCNDRSLCEYLVRNGAAVMAVTDSDGATAAQKCDPYAVGYEDCESFLRGVEEAMGVENSGVLYALWSYPAQAPDELGFREGDMVTILGKPEGVDWWWASLCGREGFVPNNYFGLFPKVRPKSLC